jgi:hypothetical protein
VSPFLQDMKTEEIGGSCGSLLCSLHCSSGGGYILRNCSVGLVFLCSNGDGHMFYVR